MRILIPLLALLALAGCQTAPFAPATVNPALTYVSNDIKAVAAAAAGNCTIPITPPGSAAVATDCLPLDPTVTTNAQNQTTLESCLVDAGSAVAGAKVSTAASVLRAQICAQNGIAVSAPAPVVTAPTPAAAISIPKPK